MHAFNRNLIQNSKGLSLNWPAANAAKRVAPQFYRLLTVRHQPQVCCVITSLLAGGVGVGVGADAGAPREGGPLADMEYSGPFQKPSHMQPSNLNFDRFAWRSWAPVGPKDPPHSQ